MSFRDTGLWRFNWLCGKSLRRMKTAMQEQYDRIAANYQKGVMYKSGEDGLTPALRSLVKKNIGGEDAPSSAGSFTSGATTFFCNGHAAKLTTCRRFRSL